MPCPNENCACQFVPSNFEGNANQNVETGNCRCGHPAYLHSAQAQGKYNKYSTTT